MPKIKTPIPKPGIHVCIFHNKKTEEVYLCVNEENKKSQFFKFFKNTSQIHCCSAKEWITQKKHHGFHKLISIANEYHIIRNKIIDFLTGTIKTAKKEVTKKKFPRRKTHYRRNYTPKLVYQKIV